MSKDKITPEEALELADLLAKINKIELKPNRPEAELTEALQKDTYLRRGHGLTKKPKKKPVHWRTRRKKAREVYHAKGKQQRQARKMRLLVSPEGWYKVIREKWVERNIPHLSLEEWTTIVYPCLGGKVPCFNRYDTQKGFEVENIVVREDKVGTVLFDGIEYRLWRLGYSKGYTGKEIRDSNAI